MNRTKYIKIMKAKKQLPDYQKYPNIPVSESLMNMRHFHSWDNRYVVQIGQKYYYLKNHPNITDVLWHLRGSEVNT